MRGPIRCALALAALSCLFSLPLPAAHQGEIEVTFHYDSEPGDYIGQGGSATWTELDGDWVVDRNFDNGVSLDFDQNPGSSRWRLDFAAPDEVELSVGFYANAVRFPFQGPGEPGLSITGEGRGCNTLTGEFEVTEVRFDWFGEPVRFQASFEQHCEGAPEALTGTVQYSQGVLGPYSPTVGNLLVVAENRLWEYTTGGVLVAEVPIMESPGTVPDTSDDHARDVVIDATGRIHVFTGTFNPVLSSLDGGSGSWQQNTHDDWAIINNGSYGRTAAFGDHVFVTDGLIGDDGIIRFDAANGYASQRFLGLTSTGFATYNSLTVGFDGLLYALRDNESTVDVYQPSTMEKVGEIELAEDVRDLAVAADGTLFGASWDNNIYRFDAAGAVTGTLDPDGLGPLHDIDLSRSGQIAVTGRFDAVAMTDTSLASFTVFTVPGSFESPNLAFVQPPPSPFAGSGFETGDTSGWSGVQGEVAGFLAVSSGAANNGTYGLEVAVGAVCGSPQDRVVGPPPTVSGVFEGCNSVTAGGVEVVDPGATFQAGSEIILNDGFSVAPMTSFSALLDPALLDGFSFVEDSSPAAAGSYQARFDLNLDDTALANSDSFDLLVGLAASGEAQFRVVIKRNAALNEDRLVLAAREDGGGEATTPAGEELHLPAGFNRIEIYWVTGAGAGQLLVSLNGSPFIGLDGLDNDLGQVDAVRLGVVAGSVGSSSGNLDIDDFYSWN